MEKIKQEEEQVQAATNAVTILPKVDKQGSESSGLVINGGGLKLREFKTEKQK